MRGYYIDKSADQILINAWSNVGGDDIPTGDPDKVAIQYSYSGSGRTCEKSGISAATPGNVDPSQVPSTPMHVVGHQAEIKSATADGTNGFTVTANVPYEGTSATSFVTLHYRQTIGGSESEEQAIEITSNGDGKTLTTSIPDDKLYGSSVTWYITANGDSGTTVSTAEQTAPVTPVMPSADSYPPLYVTEVCANDGDGQYSYFEVHNASDTAINLSHFKIFYYYNYPAYTAAQSGKVWTLSDFTSYLQPGETMVYWLSNDGKAPTLSLNTTEGFTVPTSINEGDDLKVMYDTDLLLGATDTARSNAFKDNVDASNPTNYPGGSEALKDRPYLLGTEVLYKLDDDTEWTTVRQKTQ